MRKFFATILALALVLSSFCIVSFADGNDIYFTEPTFNSERTEATAYLVVKVPATGMVALTVNYTVTGSDSYEVTDTGVCKGYDSAMTMEVGTNVTFMGNDGIPAGTGELQVAKFVVKKVSDDVTISIDSVEMYDAGMEEDFGASITTKGTTIKWAEDTPVVPGVKDVTATPDGTTFSNYKDVPLFNCGATVSGATADTKIFIEPELFLDGVSNGTRAKTEIPGLTIDGEGKVVIRIAIVGAPEGVVTINPNITAE